MSSMTAAEEAQTLLSSVEIDEERFVGLLTNLIDNVATLQNNPSQVCCLREKRAESMYPCDLEADILVHITMPSPWIQQTRSTH